MSSLSSKSSGSSRLSRETGTPPAAPERVPTWEEVAAEHGRFVYSLAYRLTGSTADAEDLAQDVLLRVRTALERYRPGSLEGWLLRITTNLFYDRMRHRSRHPTEPLVDLDEVGTLPAGSPPVSPEDTALNSELREVVAQALNQLPYQFRVAVILCDLYQMSYEEIGSTMGWRIGTVRSRIHRGRALLRGALAPYVESSRD
jgi:RNA polymerase sigma-70 factor (ECF subfamily)